ncbi:MAG: aminodeoxychorismate/anthranilate synthase component II [Betaproteobacteria bacterium]|jgi:anthranilate synthase component 2|nr:aminodeoxychorismate/anthranilate synthase component II [Betaproteobacteria bacterium]
MLLMLDNYDSFTWNLVQYLGELGEEVHTVRNDALSVAELRDLGATRLVVSPGPRTPDEAGVSVECILSMAGQIPILGVCLGHQAIGRAFGAQVNRAQTVMHGKTSVIHHDRRGVFAGLPEHFQVMRYHSLAIDRATLPGCLEISAWTDDGEIMGVRHREFSVEGVQFHPESLASEHGHAMLRNFLKLAETTR